MIYKEQLKNIDAYYDSPAIGQSKLKKLIKGYDEFIKEDNLDHIPQVVLGSAVDMLLTGGINDFYQKFIIDREDIVPSEAVKKIYDAIYEKYKAPISHETLMAELYEFAEKFEYRTNWKLDTRIKELLKDDAYYTFLVCKGDKKFLPLKSENNCDFFTANQIAEEFRKSDLVDLRDSSLTDIIYQKPIYFDFKNVSCKALPDILKIYYKDESKKEIERIEIIDIKTTSYSNLLQFDSSVTKFRYDIQGAFYREAVAKEYGIEEDKITVFLYVASTTKIQKPVLFEISSRLLEIGLYGYKNISFEGIDELMNLMERQPKETILAKEDIAGIIELLIEYKTIESKGYEEDVALIESGRKLTLGVRGDKEIIIFYSNEDTVGDKF